MAVGYGVKTYQIPVKLEAFDWAALPEIDLIIWEKREKLAQ